VDFLALQDAAGLLKLPSTTGMPSYMQNFGASNADCSLTRESGKMLPVDKERIIATLRDHEDELRAGGVEHLFLHGSCVRGTAVRDVSDVDVIAEFDRARNLSLIGRVHLENRLTDILGVKADLADRQMLRPEVLESAQRESILVF